MTVFAIAKNKTYQGTETSDRPNLFPMSARRALNVAAHAADERLYPLRDRDMLLDDSLTEVDEIAENPTEVLDYLRAARRRYRFPIARGTKGTSSWLISVSTS